MQTAIKICGLTRLEDIDAVVQAGVNAVGFVFYPKSKRYVTPATAAQLAKRLPPFVHSVGLFVDASAEEVEAVLKEVPLSLLQFHGNETPEACERYHRPYIKAIRMTPETHLPTLAQTYKSASGLLLDTATPEFGGSGQTFDWRWASTACEKPLILAGGLHAQNVKAAIEQVRPAAVDVSSGVESLPGVKCHEKIIAFVKAVREEDKGINDR